MFLPKTQQPELINALAANKKTFRSVAVFSAVINLLMLVPAIYMLQVYDRVLSSGNQWTLLMLTLLALGLFLLMGALEWVRSLLVIRIGEQFDESLSDRVYHASYQHSLREQNNVTAQSLSDLSQLRQFMTGSALFAFLDAPWFPIYLLVIFLFHPWLGVLALTGAILLIALAVINECWSKAILNSANQISAQAQQKAVACLQQADAIAAMGMFDRVKAIWKQKHQVGLTYQCVASERNAAISALAKTTRTALQSLMLGLGAYLAVKGHISAGMMVAGSILIGRMLSPVEQLVGALRQWSQAQRSKQRLEHLLQAYPAESEKLKLSPPQGNLRVEQMSLLPPGAQRPCLTNISFSISAGDVLAVLGASGSGKSCLAKALVGIWAPKLGKICFDDADISQWNQQALGQHIGYVPQEVSLFEGTLAENIARFEQPDSEAVIAAAKLAGVHELILQLPQGYETKLSEGTNGLSGGQKQRIALARALYGNPSIIVLDEPNAHLDEVGEKALAESLAALKSKGKTLILITHKVGILPLTNKVLVLNGGTVKSFSDTQTLLQALNKPSAALSKPSPVANTQFSYQYHSATGSVATAKKEGESA